MAEHAEARDVAATSDEFRKLAKDAGLELNIALQGYVASADNSRGFVIDEIQRYEAIVHKAVLHFQGKEFPKLHPNSRINWHKWVHVITKSTQLGTLPLSETIRDLFLLPIFVGEAETQDKIVGQPLSFEASFQLVMGDILLFYKSVPAS